uniref:diacylglycerol cholinephosphotransferase n=1 Tax=Phallusia mammillata TaxID=59560 RepID=A0A6F9D9P1_9ASCI|nr:choline/ethanolaminephosphotransferase 1-like [Phallusia mammillata]
MEVLTPVQLKRIDEHKYSASGTSLIQPMLEVFWNWVVELVPRWVAPNAITVAGLVANMVPSVLLIFYCPTATEVAPGWMYILNGVAIFVFLTMDAIDGKQARRTGSGSPLGELFDHGCDAVSTAFLGCTISISWQLGYHPWVMFFFCLNSPLSIYLGHWSSYVTGTLTFGLIDVTEALCLATVVFILTGLFGQDFWNASIPILGYPLYAGVITVVVSGTFVSHLRCLRLILSGGCGDNGATVANTSVLSPGINVAVLFGFAITIALQSKDNVMQRHPVLYLLFFSLIVTKLINRLVVAHMTKSELRVLDTSLISVLVMFLNQCLGSYVKEHLLLWMCFVYSCVHLALYLTYTYNKIANHLNIYIFSLESRTIKQK